MPAFSTWQTGGVCTTLHTLFKATETLDQGWLRHCTRSLLWGIVKVQGWEYCFSMSEDDESYAYDLARDEEGHILIEVTCKSMS
jgi:hypothetical protein